MATINVTDSYTLAAGTEMDFLDETAFALNGAGSPTLTIAGTLNVTTGTDGNFWGITTRASGLSTIVIAEGGSYHLSQSDGPWNNTVAGEFFGETRVENHGLIDVQTTDHGAGLVFSAGGSFENDGRISVTSPVNGAWTVVGDTVVIENRGSIELYASYGVAAQGVIDNSGLIYASADDTTTAAHAMGDFHNTGRIVATAHSGPALAVEFDVAEGVFNNEGRIVATNDGPFDVDYGLGVQLAPGTADQLVTIINSGLISADDAISAAYVVDGNQQIVVDNTGRILGHIYTGAEHDEVDNAGKIVGDVNLNEGDDVYRAVGKGKISGGVFGDGGADLLVGGKGAEALNGEGDVSQTAGENTLIGAGGADTLTGGQAVDHFVYERLSDSTAGRSDLIVFLQDADFIDLSKIDADTTHGGNQAFHLVAKLDGHAGEASLNYSKATDLTRLSLDVDGDGKADAVITVQGDHHDFAGLVL